MPEYRIECKDPAEAVGEPGKPVWEIQELTLDEHGDVVDVEEHSSYPTEGAAKRALAKLLKGLPVLKLGPRHEYKFGNGWSRTVVLNGTSYVVGVERGKMVRIAFKPRGRNRGFHWWGFVRTAEGKTVWTGQVGKSLGAHGLLKAAGFISEESQT